MRELEASLQQFGDFLLRARLVKEKAAPYCVQCVRQFLARPASNEPLLDQVRRFCEDLGVRDYLTHLAVRQHVSASTQNQALSAILFLCREVLGLHPEGLSVTARAERGSRLPVVLSVPETAALLRAMRGTSRLIAALIYGGGLRVSECCDIKDIDFDQGLIIVRGGKGAKDRSTLLAEAGRDDGVDIRQIQEYLGHAKVETTMIYTHVVKELRNPARSPLNILLDSKSR